MKIELKKKILVVEDDESAALIAETILQEHFTVTTVRDGHIAVKAVEMIKFDAVLMDINLGDHLMDGLKAMHQMKSNPKNRRLKVFAITAFSDARDWYIKQGFDDLIIKPLDDHKVLSVINKKLTTYVTGKSLFAKETAA